MTAADDNGKMVTVRPAREDDAEDLYQVRTAEKATAQTLAVPGRSFEQFAEGHNEAVNARNAYLLVAEKDGRAVGMTSLQVRGGRQAHCGSLGMMVHDDFHGQGIGTSLVESVLDLADNWLGLRRLELEVYVDNEAAIALYEKFGFQREGRKRAGAVKDGQLIDILLMGRICPPPKMNEM